MLEWGGGGRVGRARGGGSLSSALNAAGYELICFTAGGAEHTQSPSLSPCLPLSPSLSLSHTHSGRYPYTCIIHVAAVKVLRRRHQRAPELT